MQDALDSILTNIWKFGPSPDHRVGDIVFREDGRVGGYRHASHYAWKVEDGCLEVLSTDGIPTSRFDIAGFSEDGWVGDAVSSNETRNHYLSVNTSHPVTVDFCPAIEEVAARGGFYFNHFKRREGVYSNGDKIRVYPGAFIEPSAILPKGCIFNMGAFSYFGGHADCNMSIGRYCSIADDVRVFSNAHPTNWLTSSPVSYIGHHHGLFHEAGFANAPATRAFEESQSHIVTHIGNDVWIGADCLLKPGITIGDGAIVAARSIVTKDVPPYAVVGGAPARVLKYRFEENMVERLMRLRWWDLDVGGIPIRWDDVQGSVEQMEEIAAARDIRVKFDKVDWSRKIIETQLVA